MKKLNKIAQSFAASIIMLLIVIMIAAALVSTVAYQSNEAAENVTVAGGSENWTGTPRIHDAVPGGASLISLWPLLFIIAPVLFIVKEVFF